MKLLYITNSRIPTEKAHGIQIMKMCEAFVSTGLDLSLILPSRNNQIKDDPFEYYEITQKFSIKNLRTIDPRFLLYFRQGIYTKVQSLLFIFSLFFHLFPYRNKEEIILYTRDEYLLPLLLKFSKKVVWEGHKISRNKEFYLRSWKRCAKIVVLTTQMKNELVSLGVESGKVLVAPDAVDLDKFNIQLEKQEARKILNLPQDKKIVMYTGQLYNWKGANVLLETARDFELRTPNSELLFVFVGGTEFDLPKFQAKARDLNSVLLLGQKTHSDIPQYLKAADVLVLPNSGKQGISRSYTSPLKMFEYMASGRPIVSSDLPSLREILNEKNAILVEPDNSEGFQSGIERAISDIKLAKKISDQAFDDVKKYTWDNRAKSIVKFLTSTV